MRLSPVGTQNGKSGEPTFVPARAGPLRQRRAAPSSWRGNGGLCLLSRQRVDEACPRIGMALPAWFQHVAQQEQAGQSKAVLEVLIGEVALHLALAQERRQPQQAGPPRPPPPPAPPPARVGRG